MEKIEEGAEERDHTGMRRRQTHYVVEINFTLVKILYLMMEGLVSS